LSGLLETPESNKQRPLSPLLKLVLEMGPLLLFFVLNQRTDLFTATGAFVVATVVALAVHYVLVRKLPVMPLVSGVVVVVFGGLTLYLHDETFIKVKPTIVNTLFGTALLAGLWRGRIFLRYVLDSVFELTDEGWRKLTLRWGLFFLFLALVNEVVWRTQSTDFWVNFKVFGLMPLTMVFAVAQAPLLSRHAAPASPAATDSEKG
jgi:intracellular septation protein